MLEQDSSLAPDVNTEVVAEAQPADAGVPPANPIATAGSQQAPVKPGEPGFDYEWYKKDPRWGKIWKSDKDTVKSHWEADQILEKKYKPAFQEYESLKKKFAEAQIDASKLDDYIKEYQSYKDPSNPTNVRASYLSQWLDNPLYKDVVVKTFEDLEMRELERRYPNMTAEARQKMMELEDKADRLEKFQHQQQEEKMVATYTEEINRNIDRIKKLAETRGLPFDDSVKDEFLDICIKESIPPKYMYQEFLMRNEEKLNEVQQQKTKAVILDDQKTKNRAVIPMTRNTSKTEKPNTLEDGLRNLFGAGKRA